ncbi:hypothetical protein D9M72_197840 [compost metagenome]
MTFTATAETPVVGIPPRPVTLTRIVAQGATAPLIPPVPLRVSNCRNGVRDAKAPAAVGVPAR